MKRLLPRVVGVALAIAGAASASGCADNDSSLYIQGVMLLEPPDCVARAQAQANLLLGGVMDVGVNRQYRATLLVGNQQAPRGQKQRLRTETSRVTLRGAEVSLEAADGTPLLDAYSVPGTGFVTVNQSQEPGFGVFAATLLPEPAGAAAEEALGGNVSVTVIANIRVFGETLGGKEIESSELSFPISVCRGCTVFYPAEALNGNLCTGSAPDDETEFCYLGQEPVSCTQCTADICLTAPNTAP